jgi:hypothetical protein
MIQLRMFSLIGLIAILAYAHNQGKSNLVVEKDKVQRDLSSQKPLLDKENLE